MPTVASAAQSLDVQMVFSGVAQMVVIVVRALSPLPRVPALGTWKSVRWWKYAGFHCMVDDGPGLYFVPIAAGDECRVFARPAGRLVDQWH
jgi:hypothetical protein